MTEFIDSRVVKARKEHCCDYCQEAIVTGSKYQNFTGKAEGQVFHWKSHLICNFVANQLATKYAYSDEGMNELRYHDAVNDFFDEFIVCKDVGLKTFPEKIAMVANVLKDYEFVEELKKPNKPYSRFWNPVKRYLKKRETPLTIE